MSHRALKLELLRHARTLDGLPAAGAWDADDLRNASWWAVKTPGVILDEMNITNEDVRALGRDIYATFRRPWESEFEKANARFRAERGRAPGVGRDSDPAAEFRLVYSWMDPVPTDEDRKWKTYQGGFVHSWGEFERAWEAFYETHSKWHQRMWRASYDQALDFRTRVQGWRRKFEGLGGSPSAPEPHVPTEGGPLGDLPWKSILVAAGGIAAGVILLPPVIRSLQKDR